MERQKMLPDNRCCYFLTLRQGSTIIGLLHITINIILLACYLPKWSASEGETTYLDIGLFVSFGLQLVCNGLLIYSAIRKMPVFTLPWLIMNVGLIAIILVLILLLLLFGTIKMPLSTDEYTTFLSTLGVLGAVLMFCWLVVYQFCKNLIEEKLILSTYIASAPLQEDELPQDFNNCSPLPPPSYDEVSKAGISSKGPKGSKSGKFSEDELPPDYLSAVAMVTPPSGQIKL